MSRKTDSRYIKQYYHSLFPPAQCTGVVLQLDITVGQLHLSPGHSAIRSSSVYNDVMKRALPNECSPFATRFPRVPTSAVHRGGTTGTVIGSHIPLIEFFIVTQK